MDTTIGCHCHYRSVSILIAAFISTHNGLAEIAMSADIRRVSGSRLFIPRPIPRQRSEDKAEREANLDSDGSYCPDAEGSPWAIFPASTTVPPPYTRTALSAVHVSSRYQSTWRFPKPRSCYFCSLARPLFAPILLLTNGRRQWFRRQGVLPHRGPCDWRSLVSFSPELLLASSGF
jgi:hypothetical protein